VHSFAVLGLTPAFGVARISTPTPTVVGGGIDVP
jgi:hypothetical protein